MKPSIPILRIFDEEKAKAFYLDYLGFHVEWEHRFEEGFPLYMQIEKEECVLHLSEHHGDCCPGAAIRIEVKDLEKLLRDLKSKAYTYLNPSIQQQPWGLNEMEVKDPFGNRIIFYEDS